MNRIYLSVVLLLTMFATLEARAATFPLDARTMKVALHTSSEQEDGFIERVLLLVERDVLPADMVKSTFLWAKKKTRNRFQYFKEGLMLRASQAGITVK